MQKNLCRLICGLCAVLGLAVLSLPAHAIFLSSYIYEMGSDESFISKAVKNDTASNSLYKVSAVKIDRPGLEGERVMQQRQRELIFTPLKLNIAAGKTDYFKLLYIGPKDDQERYYRVSFLETPIEPLDPVAEQQGSVFLPSVSVSTILIVRPKQAKLSYAFDDQQGTLSNTGNTFFKVIIAQGCDGSDTDATQFFMLPGEHYRSADLSAKNRITLVANKQFIPLGQYCRAE